jgi:hypothetical protein
MPGGRRHFQNFRKLFDPLLGAGKIEFGILIHDGSMFSFFAASRNLGMSCGDGRNIGSIFLWNFMQFP